MWGGEGLVRVVGVGDLCLDAGSRRAGTGLLDSRFLMIDTRYWILDARFTSGVFFMDK